jgi:hypothetical protein
MLSARQRELAWFGYFSALLIWGILSFVNIIQLYVENDLLAPVIEHHIGLSDFLNNYNAALLTRQARNDRAVNIYDPAVQDRAMQETLTDVHDADWVKQNGIGRNFYFQYPPQFFVLLEPLAFMHARHAWIAWCVLALVLIGLALWRLAADAFDGKFKRAFFVTATLSSFPAWYSVRLGQPSLYQLPAIIAFWLLLRQQKYFFAGLLSAVFLIKIQYAPPLFLVGALSGRLRYLAGLTLSAAVLTGYSAIVLGAKNLIAYPQALLYGETGKNVTGVAADQMQNLRGELFLLMPHADKLISTLTIAGFVLMLVALAWLWLVPFRTNGTQNKFELFAAITTLLMLVFSLHAHMQDYLYVSLACAWIYKWSQANQAQSTQQKQRLLLILLVAFPALSWIFFLLHPVFGLLRIQPFFLWAIVVLAVLLPQTLRDRPRTE